jgi:hypothetical protein
MRRFGQVDFPEAVLNAQREARLVIFAGAGVSMPSPSDLPSFSTLAQQLADGTVPLVPNEPLDQFLGRLPEDLKVHERTRFILANPTSKPNVLHSDLIRVFLKPENIRLVTTNFDDHFSTAAGVVFAGNEPEVFAAPALPVGSRFSGIVHIHGSVTKDPLRLVLTDRDFGRAYLTEGWARRFLQDVFLNYVVLFVGYSHSDPVMHHLARGLPPGASNNQRFILTSDDKHDSWANLGITDLTYPVGPGNDHSALQVALAGWAASIVATPLETRERIRTIVAKPPEPAGEDITFIESCLNNLAELRFFAEFASSLDWLRWIEGRDAFRRLLSSQTTLTESDQVLAVWFAQNYACDHPGTALDLIFRHGSSLPMLLWSAIADTIWRRMLRREYPALLNKWIALLIERHPGERGIQLLSYIAKECRLPEDDNSLYLLLRHLLQPVMRLEPSLTNKILNPGGEPDVDPHLQVRGDITWLADVWSRIKSNHLAVFAYRLWPMASTYLEQATLVFKSFNKGGDDWDPITFSLEHLDHPSISLNNSGLAILIEVARTCFDWFLPNTPEQAEACVVTWWNSDCLTLKRLAIWGVAKLPRWSPNQKVQWLIESGVITNTVFGREAMLVLDGSFKGCTEDLKGSLVDETVKHHGQNLDQQVRDHAVHRVLLQLRRIDPGCERLGEEILALQQRTPELSPRADNSDSPSETEVSPLEPSFTQEELIAAPLTQAIDYLSDPLDGPKGSKRRAQMGVFQDAVRGDADWGIRIADALVGRGVWEEDLWSTLVGGLNNPSLSTNQWEKILALLAGRPKIVSLASYETVVLLEQGVRSESHGIEDRLLSTAMTVAQHTWNDLEVRPGRSVPRADEWLSIAINDTAGMLMQFEVRVLTRLRTLAGDTWAGMAPELQSHFTSIIESQSWAGEMARIVLASQIQIFFYVDPLWTQSKIFKIFDWQSQERRAQQAWQGYLFWGRWNNPFLELFLPYYVATIPRIETDLGRTRDSFSEHLGGIAVFGSVPPLDNGWLWDFVRKAPDQDRAHWAFAVGRDLDSVAEEQKPALWDRWMRQYWQARLDGPYPPLSPGEMAAMVIWSFKMTAIFTEIVHLILRSPAPVGSGTLLYSTMETSEALDQFPSDAAALLAHLMKNAPPDFDSPVFQMVRKLAPLVDDKTKLVEVCEELARHGSSGADQLKTFVELAPDPSGRVNEA